MIDLSEEETWSDELKVSVKIVSLSASIKIKNIQIFYKSHKMLKKSYRKYNFTSTRYTYFDRKMYIQSTNYSLEGKVLFF